MKHEYDFLVIGSGLAGLAFALKASELGRVCVLSKTRLESGNTEMAQGGIAAVVSKEDSLEQHLQDTLSAGAGLCKPEVVRQVVESGPDRIADLVKWGVAFDRDPMQNFSLTREGGHSKRRILHIEDHTGYDIQQQLLKKIRLNERIDLFEEHFAIDLITKRHVQPDKVGPNRCLGAHILNKATGDVFSISSDVTVLASGGAGKVYLYTSNWSGASGDGVAMAFRAGARIANLEFMQFHPTCLYHPQARNVLISEAVRGEGGELINKLGEAFMKNHHPLGSLAPRDIVARSIDAEMKRTGADCVYLDITQKPAEFIRQRFPQIHKRCLDFGIDMTREPVPVVPAAHYLCGGIVTDIHGKTDIDGLFAVGETACTGLHGANRLASNSLLECLVFAHNAFDYVRNHHGMKSDRYDLPAYPQHHNEDADEMVLISHLWDEIRRLMWAYVGIVRTNRRLERAQNRLENISREINEYYASFRTHSDIVELRNIALVATLTVKCALQRKESRGIHYNLDYPQVLHIEGEKPKDTLIDPLTETSWL